MGTVHGHTLKIDCTSILSSGKAQQDEFECDTDICRKTHRSISTASPRDRAQNNKHKVIILGDGQGRDLRNILQNLLGSDYDVFSHLKPGAVLSEVLECLKGEISIFTKSDYVIISGRCCDKNPSDIDINLHFWLSSTANTNCKTTTKIMIWLLLIILRPGEGQAQTLLGTIPVCADSICLTAFYDKTLRPRNQYTLTYVGVREIQANSQMILTFDSEATLKLLYPITARISKLSEDSSRSYEFIVMFTDRISFLRIQVMGPASGYSIPYVQSVVLNGVELCNEPHTGYLNYATERPKVATAEAHIDEEPAAVVKEEIKKIKNLEDTKTVEDTKTKEDIKTIEDAKTIEDKKSIEDTKKTSLDESCGRRKVAHTPSIVRGQPTQPGDWPWHAAILKFDGLSLKFWCGGTLLSKTLILTAAHCATVSGNPIVPHSLSTVLGKYNLIGGDIGAQERGVFQVIVHPAFDGKTLNNDIALLRLDSEAVLDEYVQPACLWHSALPNKELYGTVVGWGFNHQDRLSLTLQQITIPIVSELTCLKSDPLFFYKRLNTNKFCAGFANGTSVCNGDSGGGLMIFVPDMAGDTGKASGAWYVRGIVSYAARRNDAAICDTSKYTIFTDVAKYRDWVLEYLN